MEEIATVNMYDESNTNSNKGDFKIDYQDKLNNNEIALEKIPFGKDIIIYLPKGNIFKSWEKAQRYMKLYLEDYEDNDISKVDTSIEKPSLKNDDVINEISSIS